MWGAKAYGNLSLFVTSTLGFFHLISRSVPDDNPNDHDDPQLNPRKPTPSIDCSSPPPPRPAPPRPPPPPPPSSSSSTPTLDPLNHNIYRTAVVDQHIFHTLVQVQPLTPTSLSFLSTTQLEELDKELQATTRASTILVIVHQSPIMRPTLMDPIHDIGYDTTNNSIATVITESLREKELGKLVLMMSAPMAVGLFTINNSVNAPTAMHVAAVSLSVGFVLIWNGILLRRVMDQTSNVLESMGIAFMLLSFFGFIACFLPQNLIWVPSLCLLLCIAVFLFLAAKFRSRSSGQPNKAAGPASPTLPL